MRSPGPIPRLAEGRPGLLVGGLVPASFARAARHGEGWVAPSFGLATLVDGIDSMGRAWIGAGRTGRPRVVVERYFCLGEHADTSADEYLRHYYGTEYFPHVRADALTSRERIRDELYTLSRTGCDDVVLFPCSGDLEQVRLLEDAARPRERVAG